MAWHIRNEGGKVACPKCDCTVFERKEVFEGGLYEIDKDGDGLSLTDNLVGGDDCGNYEYTCHECGYVLDPAELDA